MKPSVAVGSKCQRESEQRLNWVSREVWKRDSTTQIVVDFMGVVRVRRVKPHVGVVSPRHYRICAYPQVRLS